jgi:hypothetical protein
MTDWAPGECNNRERALEVTHMTSSTRNAITAVLIFTIASSCVAATREEITAAATQGAQKAQSLCYRLVHDDTIEFGDCVRGLVVAQKEASATRLGMEYFGWVGAMNSARLGMLGANETAAEFLVRFRATQQLLGVDDQTLCASVPGDCAARMARIRQAEQGTETAPRAR